MEYTYPSYHSGILQVYSIKELGNVYNVMYSSFLMPVSTLILTINCPEFYSFNET